MSDLATIRKTCCRVLVLALLLSAVAGGQFLRLGKANPLPDIDPRITIENPQNVTYNVNTITINFTVASNWGVYPLFYSLDGRKMEPIENMTIISQEDIHAGFSPPVDRTTLKGSCVLSNLSEGRHNMTFYLITPREISLYRTYEKGEILHSATTEFMIDNFSLTDPLPMTLVAASAVSVAVVSVGFIVYFVEARRRRSE